VSVAVFGVSPNSGAAASTRHLVRLRECSQPVGERSGTFGEV